MNFVKGTMLGIVAGTIFGAMNSDSLSYMVNKGYKQIKRMKKKNGFI